MRRADTASRPADAPRPGIRAGPKWKIHAAVDARTRVVRGRAVRLSQFPGCMEPNGSHMQLPGLTRRTAEELGSPRTLNRPAGYGDRARQGVSGAHGADREAQRPR